MNVIARLVGWSARAAIVAATAVLVVVAAWRGLNAAGVHASIGVTAVLAGVGLLLLTGGTPSSAKGQRDKPPVSAEERLVKIDGLIHEGREGDRPLK